MKFYREIETRRCDGKLVIARTEHQTFEDAERDVQRLLLDMFDILLIGGPCSSWMENDFGEACQVRATMYPDNVGPMVGVYVL